MRIKAKRALCRSVEMGFGTKSCLAALVSIMLMAPIGYGAEQSSSGQGSQDHSTASAAASSVPAPSADLETQLARARQQLEQAARQVAELSAELSVERINRVWAGRPLERGIIGVQLDPASGRDGARVLEVSPGGPAADAGLRAGDLIVAVNGETIAGDDTAAQVVERLRDVPANTLVRLRLRRADKALSVELTTRPAALSAFAVLPVEAVPPVPPVPPVPGIPPGPKPVMVVPPLPNLPYLRALTAETAGMELGTLTPALGRYFGTDDGVLVIRAPSNDAFQLQDGDVIVAIDGRKPLNGAHATRILASYQPGERITLKILRQKRPITLTITLPETVPEAVR
jgi:S1-C subfamily serine protease